MNSFSRERVGRFLASAASTIYGAARAIKPTVIGDAAKQLNSDETQVNKGGFGNRGYPRRGDRGGDTRKGGGNEVIVLEKKVQVLPEAPLRIIGEMGSSQRQKAPEQHPVQILAGVC